MGSRSYIKKFTRYSLLSVLGTLGVSFYILADTFFVSKGLGTSGLAALNIAIPVFNFIHGSGLMLGMGGATKFSISKSSGNDKKVNAIFTNTVYMALIIGLLFAALGLFFSRPFAMLLGADEEVLVMTDTYLKWLLLFAPAFIMNDVLLCFVRNDESPLLATAAMLTGSIANIILDYIFIFPMQMGIFGAVFATGLSPVISMLVLSLHWIRKKNSIRPMKTGLKWNIVRQDVSLGFPSLVGQIASGVVMIVFNMLILKQEGNVGVAAYGVIANISLVVAGIFVGISEGVQPLISASYGNGDKLGYKYSMLSMLAISCIIYIVIFVFAEPITAIFNGENDLRMQRISVSGLKLYFSSVVFMGYNTIIAVFFTSAERTVPAHILSLLRGLVLIIPMAFLLSALWKMTGIWLAYPVTEGIAAVTAYVVYHKKRSKR